MVGPQPYSELASQPLDSIQVGRSQGTTLASCFVDNRGEIIFLREVVDQGMQGSDNLTNSRRFVLQDGLFDLCCDASCMRFRIQLRTRRPFQSAYKPAAELRFSARPAGLADASRLQT